MRKGQEAIITYFMERNLSKKRILEIYLNVIEWVMASTARRPHRNIISQAGCET